MIEKTTRRKKWRYWFLIVLRVVIPIIILYVIFKRIDIPKFKSNIANANPWLVVLGLCFHPLLIMIGGTRWHILLVQFNETKIRLAKVIKHYWIGLSLGFFTPAFIGWEVYRVAVSGRWFGQYALNTAVIFAEKLLGLSSCTLMIVFIYPMSPIVLSEEVQQIIYWVYILFFIFVIVLVVINVVLRNRVMSLLLGRLEGRFTGLWRKVSTRLGLGEQARKSKIPLTAMIKPLTVPKHVLSIALLSLGIYFLSALVDHIFFQALHHPVPFIANLLVAPFIFFAFNLPISFGSVGIREGAYIIFYSMFGVPAEIALLVSFFNLTGLLLNNLIGGILIMLTNFKRKELSEMTFQRKTKIV